MLLLRIPKMLTSWATVGFSKVPWLEELICLSRKIPFSYTKFYPTYISLSYFLNRSLYIKKMPLIQLRHTNRLAGKWVMIVYLRGSDTETAFSSVGFWNVSTSVVKCNSLIRIFFQILQWYRQRGNIPCISVNEASNIIRPRCNISGTYSRSARFESRMWSRSF